jgi:hypothetical protein
MAGIVGRGAVAFRRHDQPEISANDLAPGDPDVPAQTYR